MSNQTPKRESATRRIQRWRLIPNEPWMEACADGEFVKVKDLAKAEVERNARLTEERDTLRAQLAALQGNVDTVLAEFTGELNAGAGIMDDSQRVNWAVEILQPTQDTHE